MKLPKSWKDVTIGQYAELVEIQENTTDPVDRDIDTLCLLTGKSYGDILQLSLSKKRKALQSIQFLQKLDMPMKMQRRFRVRRKFYHVPKFKDITAGQYIDMMNFCALPDADNKAINKILAVVCQPLRHGIFREPYNGLTHEARSLAFLDMPMTTAYPILVFFCNLSGILTETMRDYLKETAGTMTNKSPLTTTASASDGS